MNQKTMIRTRIFTFGLLPASKLTLHHAFLIFSLMISFGLKAQDFKADSLKAAGYYETGQYLVAAAIFDSLVPSTMQMLDEADTMQLMRVAYQGDLDLVRYLISQGADCHQKGVIYAEDHRWAYGNLTGIAAGEGNLEMLKYFIEQCQIPVDDQGLNPVDGTETGWTALQWASLKGHLEVAGYLIDQGADVDHQATGDGWTPLMIAATNNNIHCCKFLLDCGADMQVRDAEGRTALDLAREYGLLRISAFLGNPATYTDDPTFEELNKMQISLYDEGKYPEAIEYAERAMNQAEIEYGDYSEKYSLSLNELAFLYGMTGNYPAALPLLEDALRIRKEVLGSDHPEFASSLNNLAALYHYMGDYPAALPLYEEALRIRKEVLGADHPDYALSLNNMATLYQYMGNYPAALPLFEEASSIYKEVLGAGHPDYASILNNLAGLYESIGNYPAALPLYEEALRIRKKVLGTEHPDYANSLFYIAILYGLMGDYPAALPLFEEASRIYKEVLGPDHPDYAGCLNSLALLYLNLGNYSAALSLYEEVLRIDKDVLGEDHPGYATDLNNLALVYGKMGNYAAALPLVEQASGIYKETLGAGHPDYASILNNLAGLYQKMGNYSMALPLYEEAFTIVKEVLGTDHPACAKNMSNLGGLYESMGNYLAALPLYEEALRIRKEVLGTDHPDYTSSLNNLGGLYESMGNYLAALPLYKEANEILNRNMEEIILLLSDESEKKGYFETVGYYYEIYLSFMEEMNGQYPEYSKEVFDNELLRKGMILASVQSLSQSILQSGDTVLIRNFEQLSLMKQQITRLQQQPYSENLTAYITTLEQESRELNKELARESSDFAQMQQQFSITWQDVQKALQPEEAAVEFISFKYNNGREWTDSTLYSALIVRPGDTVPHYVFLCEESQLKHAAPRPGTTGLEINQAYRGERGVGTLQMHDSVSAQTPSLYELVWKPLDSLLQGTATVYFAPSGLLHSVSMAAIALPDNSLLMDRYDLLQLGSTRTLAMPAPEEELTDAVVYGGIQYDMDTLSLAEEAGKYTMDEAHYLAFHQPGLRNTGGTGFQYLEGTRKEAEIISKVLEKNGVTVTEFEGDKALEESFMSLSGAEAPSVVHVATHGFYLPDTITNDQTRQQLLSGAAGADRFRLSDDPLLRSGLVLTGGNLTWTGGRMPERLEDGILTAREVSNLNLLNTELVVLSACQTGLGDVKGSEGVEGLLRSFKMAGVRYLILSLWEVPDKETVEFMEHFYHYLMKERDIRTAFHHTQRQMRDKYPKDPYKWAAFILVE